MADWGYEADAEFRRELHERGLNADLAQAPRTTITRDWTGRPPVSTLAKLVTPPARAQPGASRGEKAPASAAASPQRNKPPGGRARRNTNRDDVVRIYRGRDLLEAWLIAGAPEPVKCWLPNLPAQPPKRSLVRCEHDNRVVRTGPGPQG
ncbi:hypothetical protein [Phytohabitans aurantiacus]|uniref:Transposase IS701-like DDE domain-containing protein n=1 Tax=Phytohabitans aurantiacus TaxID=3016789 RepID=A0ABQ5QQ09_9ACTN|nr:hypothetical protein [Phytohabitans aurantiacus]GLH95952.1 hypothetical protein Pa4123_12250 [Phytohabitans aurantiacus]